jgi:hypothetical protein
MQQQYGGPFPGPHAVNGDALVGCYIEALEPAHESVFRHGVTLPMYSLKGCRVTAAETLEAEDAELRNAMHAENEFKRIDMSPDDFKRRAVSTTQLVF